MKPYNLKKLSNGLREAAQQLKGKDITQIAAIEHVDQSTVREYLKGNIAKPALAKAILDRSLQVLVERNQNIATA